MYSFHKTNNIVGWVVFLIASLVYILTLEPTASFWDCGEFIAASYKLQVPHPPGAPFFLMIGRAFSLLAMGDVTKVAYWINVSSALSSGATIMFLYWTIVLLARKFAIKKGELPSQGTVIAIIGAGLIGSLAYAFSDSFWFSAVEAEVYAMSSFFTAFVFWGILKWESLADDDDADRWLILIAYMMGLSIGVHILNLVTIPALGFVYYFKKYKPSLKGALATLGISGIFLGIINSGIIPGLPTLAGKFEVFFVNNIGLPFGGGTLIFLLGFVSALIYSIYYSVKKQKRIMNLILVGFTFILIGYCSYTMILVRSNFNPPIDENNPQDVMSFVSYLKREQYGDRPLLYGPYLTAELISQDQTDPIYRKGEKKYEIYDYKMDNKFDPDHYTILPRIYSRQPGHSEAYKRWVGLEKGKKPTMGQNLAYLFKYQLGHMYWRYFMWNFAGRESDIQNAAWLAPWQSGTADLPELLAKNKARNNFFMLPFLLGLLGIIFHYMSDKKGAFVVLLLFFLTGMALTLYLNSPPIEPRERDYIFVGSYYAFAIWIGLGVFYIIDLLVKTIKNETARSYSATAICAIVPAIMLYQGWDDHNRTGRYHSVDSAKNLLNSCAPNAIIFTGGDNDTFPLWYVQEVEGFRTDVRVCNLSLLNTDWYIDQMKMQAYESAPLPISLESKNYLSGTNDYLPFVERAQVTQGMNLMQYIKLVKENHPAISVQLQNGSFISILPTKKFILPIDTNSVNSSGILPESIKARRVSEIVWDLKKSAIDKKDLIILDMLATNNWKRPIYFSTTLSNSNYMNLKEYMQLEGLAYRLLPAKMPEATQGYIDTDIMYERMMKNFYWRGLQDTNVYYDENFRRFPLNVRNSFYRLADEYLKKGNKEKAREVALYSLQVLPDKTIPYDVYSPQILSLLFEVGEKNKAMEIINVMGRRAEEELKYYQEHRSLAGSSEFSSNLYILNQLYVILNEQGETEKAKKYEQLFSQYYPRDQANGGSQSEEEYEE